MTLITLLYEAGPGVGMGHQRRMAALTSALRNYEVETLLTPFAERVPADVAVVDSYLVRADEPGLVQADFVVAVDDLDRGLAVDVLVDPNPPTLIDQNLRAKKLLVGPRYALLDPEITKHSTSAITEEPRIVLVATGATDELGVGATIAEQLVAERTTWLIRLVVGPWGLVTPSRDVELIERTDGLIDELANADIVVTAGGVTMLEALCLGRPTIALVTAANQRRSVRGAIAENAALGATPDNVTELVKSLSDDLGRRLSLSATARSYIDGLGAARVAEDIYGLI